ncbi:MAG: ATP-grasp peptide maturase system methyltransferase [Pseudonocardiaceae bacterium]
MIATEELLRRRLATELVDKGAITSPEWRTAFENVPRHFFVPKFFLHADGGGMRAVDSTDDDWLDSAYKDLTLVTQLEGDDAHWTQARTSGPAPGRPTSSSTQPLLMAWMLEAMNLQPSHRVLEVGVGTGYNAALLTHRLGAAQVTSIDIDEAVVQRARSALDAAGYRPSVYPHDGTRGFPDDAPYDRIIATCSFPRVPLAWLKQTRPGGLILSHLYTDFDAGGLALLTVADDGGANGTFLPEYGAFMPRRGFLAPDTLALLQRALRDPDDGDTTPTRLTADDLTAEHFPLFAALRLTDTAMHWFQPAGTPAMQTWLLGRDGSWAYQTFTGDGLVAVQGGPRRLWSEVEHAYDEWIAAGSPERHRIGLTVAPDGTHCVWIDTPHSARSWPLAPIDEDD